MSETLLSELLFRWEEGKRQGQPVSAEELCRNHAELLPALQQQIAAIQELAPLLEAGGQAGDRVPHPVPPTPGKRIAVPAAEELGRYVLRARHAQGGLGEVYLALDQELNRDVALKRIRPERDDGDDSRRRFLVEGEVTGRLEHPGVVPVYGLGHDSAGRPFYVMRFVRGETLQEAIRCFHQADRAGRDPGQGRLAMQKLLAHFVAVCNAVGYAHSRGILHCDLKPANVMLGPYGETLVVDWGLAQPFQRGEVGRDTGEETLTPTSRDAEPMQQGQAAGTPQYISPEQARGRWERVGPASDIYSLGATLYTLLTDALPFEGRHVAEIMDKVKEGEFRPPRQRKTGVPPALEAICLKAMALKPEDRYPSARALAEDVERWLADEPVSAYREPWPVRLGRWSRRHRTAVAGVVAALAVAVVFLGVLAGVLESANRTARVLTTRAQESARQADQEKDKADEQRLVAEKNFALALDATVSIKDLAERLRPITGSQSRTVEEILNQASLNYEGLVKEVGETPRVLAGKGKMLNVFSDLYLELGSTTRALAAAEQAERIYQRQVAADRDNPDWQAGLALSLDSKGLVLACAARRCKHGRLTARPSRSGNLSVRITPRTWTGR